MSILRHAFRFEFEETSTRRAPDHDFRIEWTNEETHQNPASAFEFETLFRARLVAETGIFLKRKEIDYPEIVQKMLEARLAETLFGKTKHEMMRLADEIEKEDLSTDEAAQRLRMIAETLIF